MEKNSNYLRIKVLENAEVNKLISECKVKYICHISETTQIIEILDTNIDYQSLDLGALTESEEVALRKFWRFQNSEIADLHLERQSTKYSREEQQTWEFQAEAAKAYINGEDSPLIQSLEFLAVSKNKTIDELANSILNKKYNYEDTMMKILAKKSQKDNTIDTGSVEQLLNLPLVWEY